MTSVQAISLIGIFPALLFTARQFLRSSFLGSNAADSRDRQRLPTQLCSPLLLMGGSNLFFQDSEYASLEEAALSLPWICSGTRCCSPGQGLGQVTRSLPILKEQEQRKSVFPGADFSTSPVSGSRGSLCFVSCALPAQAELLLTPLRGCHQSSSDFLPCQGLRRPAESPSSSSPLAGV